MQNAFFLLLSVLTLAYLGDVSAKEERLPCEDIGCLWCSAARVRNECSEKCSRCEQENNPNSKENSDRSGVRNENSGDGRTGAQGTEGSEGSPKGTEGTESTTAASFVPADIGTGEVEVPARNSEDEEETGSVKEQGLVQDKTTTTKTRTTRRSQSTNKRKLKTTTAEPSAEKEEEQSETDENTTEEEKATSSSSSNEVDFGKKSSSTEHSSTELTESSSSASAATLSGKNGDYEPTVQKPEANERFRSRCELIAQDNGFPKPCIDICKYDVTGEELQKYFFGKGGCSLDRVSQYLWAASDGNDNYDCCRAKGVFSDTERQNCKSFCGPTGPPALGVEHFSCGGQLQTIMRCHWAGLS